MTSAWIVVAAVGLGTIVTKAVGPVLLGGRPLPGRLTRVVGLLAPALLAALVAVQTFGSGRALVVDERVVGVVVAAIALIVKAPSPKLSYDARLLFVVVIAAAGTAIARAVM
jgi:Branched-chain amino acid transport protein (AzlD)